MLISHEFFKFLSVKISFEFEPSQNASGNIRIGVKQHVLYNIGLYDIRVIH